MSRESRTVDYAERPEDPLLQSKRERVRASRNESEEGGISGISTRDRYSGYSVSGHTCTCTLLLLLLGIFGGILGIMVSVVLPLSSKAHDVGDEALLVADVAKTKITNIDLQINDFLEGGNAKLALVEVALAHVEDATGQVSLAVATVHELSERMHLVLNDLNQTNTEMRQQMQQTQQTQQQTTITNVP